MNVRPLQANGCAGSERWSTAAAAACTVQRAIQRSAPLQAAAAGSPVAGRSLAALCGIMSVELSGSAAPPMERLSMDARWRRRHDDSRRGHPRTQQAGERRTGEHRLSCCHTQRGEQRHRRPLLTLLSLTLSLPPLSCYVAAQHGVAQLRLTAQTACRRTGEAEAAQQPTLTALPPPLLHTAVFTAPLHPPFHRRRSRTFPASSSPPPQHHSAPPSSAGVSRHSALYVVAPPLHQHLVIVTVPASCS